jgi:protein subunit release factor B
MNKENKKQILFSLTKKDFIVEYYNPGKNGGQNANKVATACRIHHPASGAIGDCHEERTQKPNRERAFDRLVKSVKFQKWHKIETAKRQGLLADIDKKVEKALAEAVVEIQENGRWTKVPEGYFDNLKSE